MNHPLEQGFVVIEADQFPAFAQKRATTVGAQIPPAHEASVIENLRILQAHAKVMTQALSPKAQIS